MVPSMSFSSLGLSESILQAVAEQGYESPSPIQVKAIPVVLDGVDVMAAAQTGTGKTAGFTLPLLERLLQSGQQLRSNNVRALVVTPTRELAAQVHDNVEHYSKHINLRSTVVFGGVKINPQMMRLRKGVDVLVATPGRLLDLHNQNAVRFDQLEILVLDEADRMLDMGFIHDIKRIMKVLPKKRQNLLFSATFSDEVRGLAKTIVNDPVEISVTPRNATAKTVEQWLVPVDKKQKSSLLLHLITENRWEQVLVFSRTKHGANKLTKYLCEFGVPAAAIHGNKSQGARTRALAEFKDKKVRVLVATDIAARGIDIEQLPQVVNFDLPNVPEDYVHRIGRTGRAGSTGEAVSLVSNDEFKQLVAIERLTQKLIRREYIEGYDPVADLAISNDIRPLKAKKPKKNKPRSGGGERNRNRSDSKRSDSRDDSRDENRGNRSKSAKSCAGRGRSGGARSGGGKNSKGSRSANRNAKSGGSSSRNSKGSSSNSKGSKNNNSGWCR